MPAAFDTSMLDRYHGPPAAARTVVLVGNPNCGKTTIFNALTGEQRAVGNWAGVTVAGAVGRIADCAVPQTLVDLPGTYSLAAGSPDEEVTRDVLLDGRYDLVVNVLDAANLERNLYLTMQLLELGRPVVVALNMLDVAERNAVDVDPRRLAAALGCPVVPIVASRGEGVAELVRQVGSVMRDEPVERLDHLPQVGALADAIDRVTTAIERGGVASGVGASALAVRLLEYDEEVERRSDRAVVQVRDEAARQVHELEGEEADILIADARYGRIGDIAAHAVRHGARLGTARARRLDSIVLHPRLGIPIFLAVMYAMFTLTINVGSAFIDAFDQLGGLIFVDLPGAALERVGVPELLVVLLADAAGGGLQTVVTFIPPVGIMFLCLRLLEEVGYMARAAFVMDRFMRRLGLPGKAFVPMIVGFGCNVPAIMGARTLEREQDRKLAVAMNPFMSCGARLPVYALFAAAFFPGSGQLVVFALYLIGICFAILTGLLLKRTLLQGDLAPFVMELPPYQRPSASSVLRGAWARLRSFLVGAGRLIVPVVAALTILSSVGTDGTYGNDNTERSVLSAVGRALTPVFSPMGIEPDNWPATVGLFTGIFAKEAVVGSLDALYSRTDPEGDDGSLDVGGTLVAALATVPPALGDAARSMLDPLGLSVGPTDSTSAAADAQGVSSSTFTALQDGFGGQAAAFAYLLFVLLYLPCVAATAAIARETGTRWAAFVGCWTTGLAYLAAVSWYQLATFADHPSTSAAWLLAVAAAGAAAVHLMRREAARESPPGAIPTAAHAPVRVRSVAAPPQPADPTPEPGPQVTPGDRLDLSRFRFAGPVSADLPDPRPSRSSASWAAPSVVRRPLPAQSSHRGTARVASASPGPRIDARPAPFSRRPMFATTTHAECKVRLTHLPVNIEEPRCT